ncbi:MAG: hypothetical protein IAI49_05155 [Candidatus Eremiobacteraeota bacterium]|nr:hypothetical protein [Candidatus Eremiobacteraeota bacterium]
MITKSTSAVTKGLQIVEKIRAKSVSTRRRRLERSDIGRVGAGTGRMGCNCTGIGRCPFCRTLAGGASTLVR